ncbi:MAG: acyl dehydratase [Hyphomicrobiales bacterium]|nr:acyl dehydratase [Hyphomicrobiales bacterium]
MTAAAPRSLAAAREGDTFAFTKAAVTTRQLVMYAGASGDYNRIHYDHHFAVEAGLGGVIAHGMLTMGFLAQAVADWAGPGAMVRDVLSRFVSPVKPGDVVAFTGTVTAVDAAAGTCALDVEGAVAGRPVIRGAAVVALPPSGSHA